MADDKIKCRKCLQEKPINAFSQYVTFEGKKYRRKTCSTCRGKQYDKKAKLITGKKLCRNNRLKAIKYFGGVCSRCGGKFHPVCFEFHHIEKDTKTKNPSKILTQNFEKAIDELSGCILVCSNCHKLIHFEYEIEEIF